MLLRLDDGPEDAAMWLGRGLARLVDRGALGAAEDSGRASEFARTLTAGVQHRVFDLWLNDLQLGRGLEAARFAGWRYLIYAGDRVVASAELGTTESGGTELLGINRGPFSAATADAIQRAEAAFDATQDVYEPRLLRIVSLKTVALWLHLEAGNDLMIPLDPSPEKLSSKSMYGAEEFLSVMRQIASP